MSSQYRLRRRKHMKHVLPRIVFWLLFCLVTRRGSTVLSREELLRRNKTGGGRRW
jgi:hypothetical protein